MIVMRRERERERERERRERRERDTTWAAPSVSHFIAGGVCTLLLEDEGKVLPLGRI
jgi:hypothetical protein